MILCGEKTAGNGDTYGSGVGYPPRQKSGGGRKWRSDTKKHSYLKISGGA